MDASSLGRCSWGYRFFWQDLADNCSLSVTQLVFRYVWYSFRRLSTRLSLLSYCLPLRKCFGRLAGKTPGCTACGTAFHSCNCWYTPYFVLDRFPAALRHVQGFPLLRLLWRLRCHAGFSASFLLVALEIYHLAALRIAVNQRSGLGNLRLGLLNIARCDVGWDFRPLFAYCGWSPRIYRGQKAHYSSRRGARLLNHPYAVGSAMPPWTVL